MDDRFVMLLNEEHPRLLFEDGMPNEGLSPGIDMNEIKAALTRMKKVKATEIDGIPMEVWTCLGEEGNVYKGSIILDAIYTIRSVGGKRD